LKEQELLWRCEFERDRARPYSELRALAELLPEEPTRTIEISPPWGEGRPHDTDHLVDEYEIEAGQDKPLSFAVSRGRTEGGIWVYRWHIVYNLTKIEPLNPTPDGFRLLRRHERFHTKGYKHGEGSEATNGCYSPTVNLWA